MTSETWLSADEKPLYDSILDGLRKQGWSRFEAESEAMDRILAMRESNTRTGEKA